MQRDFVAVLDEQARAAMRPRPSDEPVISIRAIETPFETVLLRLRSFTQHHAASKEREKAISFARRARTWQHGDESVSKLATADQEEQQWALRDSNPRPQPCEGCALTS